MPLNSSNSGRSFRSYSDYTETFSLRASAWWQMSKRGNVLHDCFIIIKLIVERHTRSGCLPTGASTTPHVRRVNSAVLGRAFIQTVPSQEGWLLGAKAPPLLVRTSVSYLQTMRSSWPVAFLFLYSICTSCRLKLIPGQMVKPCLF